MNNSLFKKPTEQLRLNLPTTSNKKYLHHDLHQIDNTDEVVNFIGGDMLQLSVVESSTFRNLYTSWTLNTKCLPENIFPLN